MSVHHHKKTARTHLRTWVITVSDSRNAETDTGGALLKAALQAAEHPLAGYAIVPDDIHAIRAVVEPALADDTVDTILLTGGTGLARRDVTIEAISPLLERHIPGFGEIFRMLSYQEIGSAAILSRALAGLARGKVLFALPGSRGALRLAMEKLILPELGHLVSEAQRDDAAPPKENPHTR